MDEEILRSLIRGDEAVPLVVVEPLDDSVGHKKTPPLLLSRTCREGAGREPDSLSINEGRVAAVGALPVFFRDGWQYEPEPRSVGIGGLVRERPSVRAGERLRDREAEARSLTRFRGASCESLEDASHELPL